MTSQPAPPPAQTKALTPVQQRRLTLRNLFDQQKPELAKLLPRGMDAERLFRMALTECVKQPKLLECTAESWALSLQVCAAQGLYPDSGLGYMYLVPRKNTKAGVMEVSAMRGYQGDIKLCRNTGELFDIYAEVVHAKDEFKVVKGLNRDIIHVPSEDEDPGKLRAVYAVAKLRGGETAWVVLQRRDVERHRASSESADADWSPWKKHEEAMWRKTAIHELAKWLPKANEEFEKADRSAPGQTVDVTPLGRTEVPLAPPKTLDAVADQLAAAGPGCTHPKVTEAVLAAVPVGQLWPCEDCGEELKGTKPAAARCEKHADVELTEQGTCWKCAAEDKERGENPEKPLPAKSRQGRRQD